ncbi:hypothetical protein BO70DRAFT_133675 [Aspergillus heteromorphus CBS 117.55]|uniref:Uncharacterized protein n=1 Tax=Aspergillus heteromorphus CBS 117.55 TaxID=1448321 RepID=A0A317WZA4_9EURO|nr:uncharacterized protein BO70DRAFT_133675 [Aspergillus heteromorphus CBS 117.55]PWY90068.1 hypothetical protein BO70DRAFT_133675 [Aspergillus heteromorphus CBS 117.55]
MAQARLLSPARASVRVCESSRVFPLTSREAAQPSPLRVMVLWVRSKTGWLPRFGLHKSVSKPGDTDGVFPQSFAVDKAGLSRLHSRRRFVALYDDVERLRGMIKGAEEGHCGSRVPVSLRNRGVVCEQSRDEMLEMSRKATNKAKGGSGETSSSLNRQVLITSRVGRVCWNATWKSSKR